MQSPSNVAPLCPPRSVAVVPSPQNQMVRYGPMRYQSAAFFSKMNGCVTGLSVCTCFRCSAMSAFKAIGRHNCPHCKKSFSRGYRLTCHIKGVHKGVKPYPCPHAGCTKRYTEKSRLNDHLKRSAHHGGAARPASASSSTVGSATPPASPTASSQQWVKSHST